MPLTPQQLQALNTVQGNVHNQYQFLLRAPGWAENDANIQHVANSVRPTITALGGNMVDHLTALEQHYYQTEQSLTYRMNRIELAIRSFGPDAAAVSVAQFESADHIQTYLQTTNTNGRTGRMLQHAGFALMAAFGFGGAEAIFNLIPGVSGAAVGLFLLIGGGAYIAIDELYWRQQQIQGIMAQIRQEISAAGDLAQMREQLIMAQAMRRVYRRLMENHLGVVPVVQQNQPQVNAPMVVQQGNVHGFQFQAR